MTKVQGHRGAGMLEPENTLRAMKRAISLGLDSVELDARRCKSGEIVAFHDDTLDRTTNTTGLMSNLALAELQQLDAGKGERIPTLQEVIDVCKGKIEIYVELKDTGIEKDVADILEQNKVVEESCVISFMHSQLKKITEINESIKTGILIIGRPLNPLAIMHEANATVYSTNHEFVDEQLRIVLRKAGKLLVAGRCNTPETIRAMIDLDVDVISSEQPETVVRMNS